MNNYLSLSELGLFHCVSANLEKGSVILPGGYGETINRYGRFETACIGDTERLLYEQNLEAYRVKNHPDKPSRLKGLFLCPSIEGARKFMEAQDRYQDRIYRVEMVGDANSCKPHIASWLTFDTGCMVRDVRSTPEGYKLKQLHNDWQNRMEQFVKRYWDGEDLTTTKDKDNLEILIECPVKIMHRVF